MSACAKSRRPAAEGRSARRQARAELKVRPSAARGGAEDPQPATSTALMTASCCARSTTDTPKIMAGNATCATADPGGSHRNGWTPTNDRAETACTIRRATARGNGRRLMTDEQPVDPFWAALLGLLRELGPVVERRSRYADKPALWLHGARSPIRRTPASWICELHGAAGRTFATWWSTIALSNEIPPVGTGSFCVGHCPTSNG